MRNLVCLLGVLTVCVPAPKGQRLTDCRFCSSETVVQFAEYCTSTIYSCLLSPLQYMLKYLPTLVDHAFAEIFCVRLSEVNKLVLALEICKLQRQVKPDGGKLARDRVSKLQTSSALSVSHQPCVCAFVWVDEWVKAKC